MRTFFLLLLLSLISCESPSSYTSIRGIAMTMEFQVQTETDSKHSPQQIREILDKTFAEVDKIYNKWNKNSEISKLNASSSTSPQPISSKLFELLKKTDFIVKLTEGRFDPTIEPVQDIWKKSLVKSRIPTPDEIEGIRPCIGWDKVHFNSQFFWKDDPKLQIDLSGIAKGYAVDLLFERLQDAGFKHLYVEWGGEIRVSKNHPLGRSWNIEIKQIDSSSKPQILEVTAEALATSGDYEQNWVVEANGEKKTYFHIINPSTLTPLEMRSERIASATVFAPTCFLADGLATSALFFESMEEAVIWSTHLKSMYPELTFYFTARNYDQNSHL